MALFPTQKPFSPFSYENPSFVQESGCDLMISRRVDGGRCVTQFWPHIKGVAEGVPGEIFSPDETEVSGHLPSLLPARTVRTRWWRCCALCSLGRKAERIAEMPAQSPDIMQPLTNFLPPGFLIMEAKWTGLLRQPTLGGSCVSQSKASARHHRSPVFKPRSHTSVLFCNHAYRIIYLPHLPLKFWFCQWLL